jgi:CubicO group peptidase (beta-lactamase class C family)
VAAITLRQLATHTSGLPRLPEDLMAGADPLDPYAHYDRTHLDACMAKVKLAHAPPFPTAYSNFGTGLLGDLLARLYHGDWEKLVVDRIARPLGMKDTCVTLTAEQKRRHAPPYKQASKVKPWHFAALAGAGALHSTAADLLRFAAALDQPATTPLKEAIELIEQPQGTDRFGLCLLVSLTQGKTTYWYQGGTGGYGSWISADPATHEKVVVLINNSALLPEKVLFGEPEPVPTPAGSADSTLAAYAGEYDTGVKAGAVDIHYTFEVRGDDLWMQITGQQFNQLTRHPTVKDRFEFKPVKAEIQFKRNKDEVVSATLFQSGLEIHARKLPVSKKSKP